METRPRFCSCSSVWLEQPSDTRKIVGSNPAESTTGLVVEALSKDKDAQQPRQGRSLISLQDGGDCIDNPLFYGARLPSHG